MIDTEHENLIGKFPSLPQQERAQQKRVALMNSGRELFIQNGYENTTAKLIATNAGVATGTFYRYFSDKRQLLLSLLDDKLDHLIPSELDWINKDSEELLADHLSLHYENLKDIPLKRILSELAKQDSELSLVISEARKKIHKRITIEIQRVKEQGLTWDDIDANTVAWSILTIFENIPEIEAEYGIERDYRAVAKIICRMIFRSNTKNTIEE